MLGYNLFSQYIWFFCGFKLLFNTFSPRPPQTGLDWFFVVLVCSFLVLGISGTGLVLGLSEKGPRTRTGLDL